MTILHNAAAIAAFIALTIPPAKAQDAEKCRVVKDDKERLACFDQSKPPAAIAAPKKPAASSQVALAKTAVTRLLNDPGSARFSDVKERKAADGTSGVCGAVNAKNTTGGYAGEKLFVYADKYAYVLDSTGSIISSAFAGAMLSEGLKRYEKFCSKP